MCKEKKALLLCNKVMEDCATFEVKNETVTSSSRGFLSLYFVLRFDLAVRECGIGSRERV